MALTEKDRLFLKQVTRYAQEAMPGQDPRNIRVCVQLDQMMPVFQEIAAKEGVSIEDIFIRYMDLASEAMAADEEKLKKLLEG